ncbi:hypothetical protein D3C85_757810 [compost metagenome]
MPKILILDLETTGFIDQGGKIVEVGIVELCLKTGNKKILFDQVTHEKGITLSEVENSWIVQNSTMTVDAIRNSKPLHELQSEIQNILDEYPEGCTAFNNAFDFGFMCSRGFVFPKKLACPMKLSTDVCKIPSPIGSGYKWPKVQEAYDFFFGKTDYIETHRGADDAFHEADIVLELYKRGIFKLN